MRLAALLALLLVVSPCLAQKSEKVDAAFFETRVKPILQKSCLGCHGVGATLGGLDLRTRAGAQKGGPPVYPPVDPSLRADTFQGMNWPEGEDSPKTWRRSVYVKVKRSLLLPQLEVFDCPEITYTVEKRNITTTPLQALTLLNDPLILKQAGFFAERLEKERPNNVVAQVNRAYQLCLSRSPSPAEMSLSLSFLKTRSLTEFCHSMLNLNEFVYVP